MSERNTGLGQRLRALRKQRELTSEEVARAIGTTQSHLCSIERGRIKNPRLKLLLALSEHYGLSLSVLVGQDVNDESNLKGKQMLNWFNNELSEHKQQIAYKLVEQLRHD